mmetsp:Transcript_40133/g.85638  ORF Transcript_40133/g.85638 Transcript_40133/m.85638 type:complete len:224 (-) Transcript_40133:175-846(-)
MLLTSASEAGARGEELARALGATASSSDGAAARGVELTGTLLARKLAREGVCNRSSVTLLDVPMRGIDCVRDGVPDAIANDDLLMLLSTLGAAASGDALKGVLWAAGVAVIGTACACTLLANPIERGDGTVLASPVEAAASGVELAGTFVAHGAVCPDVSLPPSTMDAVFSVSARCLLSAAVARVDPMLLTSAADAGASGEECISAVGVIGVKGTGTCTPALL